jgi:hypothetical protein
VRREDSLLGRLAAEGVPIGDLMRPIEADADEWAWEDSPWARAVMDSLKARDGAVPAEPPVRASRLAPLAPQHEEGGKGTQDGPAVSTRPPSLTGQARAAERSDPASSGAARLWRGALRCYSVTPMPPPVPNAADLSLLRASAGARLAGAAAIVAALWGLVAWGIGSA